MNLQPIIALAEGMAAEKGDHKRIGAKVSGMLLGESRQAVVHELASVVFHAQLPALMIEIEALIEREKNAITELDAAVAEAAQAQVKAKKVLAQAEADLKIKSPPRRALGWEDDQKQRESLSAAVVSARGEIGRASQESKKASRDLEAARVRLRGFLALLADLKAVEPLTLEVLPQVWVALT